MTWPDEIVEKIAERLDDPLTMLGVNPTERQCEDIAGALTEFGPTTAEILARAALNAIRADVVLRSEMTEEQRGIWGVGMTERRQVTDWVPIPTNERRKWRKPSLNE